MKRSISVLLFTCLFAGKLMASGLSTNIMFSVEPKGSFTGRATMHVETQAKHHEQELEVEIILDLGDASNISAFASHLNDVSGDEISCRVLTDGRPDFDLKRKSPQPGRPPVGAANAGTGYVHFMFWFDCSPDRPITAIVVKIKGETRTFPIAAK